MSAFQFEHEVQSSHRCLHGPSGEEIPVFEVIPTSLHTRPGLVIVPSIFGIEQDVQEQAIAFAKVGAHVLVLDPFWRHSPGPLPFSPEGTALALARKTAFQNAWGHSDLSLLLEYLKKDKGNNGHCLALGICFGGKFAFEAAAQQQVDAAIIWHGGGLGSRLHLAQQIQCPLVMHFGDRDPLIPLEEVKAIQQAFASHDHVRCVIHPGAVHGFTHTSKTASYDPDATKASMDSVRDWVQGLI